MNLIAMLMLATDLNGQPLPDVVLLDFTAGYCQPCQQMVPVLQRMEKDKFPIRKIDISEQPQISRQYRVDRVPTFILLVEGKEAKRFTGLRSEQELRQAMNEAARQLHESREASQAPDVAQDNVQLAVAEAPPVIQNNAQPETRPGLRGFFDKMKRGISGDSADPESRSPATEPSIRAQSPEPSAADAASSPAMRATVRVRLMDGDLRDVGTGTIIQSTAGQSTILTCAHIFQKVNDQAVVEVDVFQDGKVLKYPAKVLGGDHESDVALLQIVNATALPTSPLAAAQVVPVQKEALFSIGCSDGDLPTRLNMNVIEVDRYNGPQNILCTNDPAQGRSGGGLFNSQNQVVGVCSAADRKAHEGLYTGVKPVRKLISQLKLDSLFDSQPAPFDEAAADAAPAFVDNSVTPFADGRDLLDEFFAEEGDLEEFAEAAETEFADAVSGFADALPSSLPDPFGSAAAAPAVTAAATGSTSPGPAEVTVIIDSKDPTRGKQVIVIPQPSPWLMELLTGEKPAEAATGLAATRHGRLSTTSSRSARRLRTGSSRLLRN